jgi:acetoin utilization protein AcuB
MTLLVKKFMTPMPHTVGVDQPLSVAHRMMREHAIRHLPVLSGGKLAGILSERDMALVETLRDVDPETVQTGEAMSQLVYAVEPETPLATVAAEMAEHKYGCAVVMAGQKVVGVFTTVDAMRALAALLDKGAA